MQAMVRTGIAAARPIAPPRSLEARPIFWAVGITTWSLFAFRVLSGVLS